MYINTVYKYTFEHKDEKISIRKVVTVHCKSDTLQDVTKYCTCHEKCNREFARAIKDVYTSILKVVCVYI